jgi:hypothetical protein
LVSDIGIPPVVVRPLFKQTYIPSEAIIWSVRALVVN